MTNCYFKCFPSSRSFVLLIAFCLSMLFFVVVTTQEPAFLGLASVMLGLTVFLTTITDDKVDASAINQFDGKPSSPLGTSNPLSEFFFLNALFPKDNSENGRFALSSYWKSSQLQTHIRNNLYN